MRHVLFIARYNADCFEVSDLLPVPRRLPGHDHLPYPVTQGYELSRLVIQSEDPPILPEGDLSEDQLREWASILDRDTYYEERVDQKLSREMGGLCVKLDLILAEYDGFGLGLEARVTNIGPYPIGNIQVMWFGQWDPTPTTQHIGEGYHFEPRGWAPREIQQGELRGFLLGKEGMQKGLRLSSSLRPEQYHIAVLAALPGQTAMYEIHRRPGTDMGNVVEAVGRRLAEARG